MDLIRSAEQLKGWVPIRVSWQGSEPSIDWVYAGQARFTEPFFDQTIERLLAKPFNLAFRRLTGVDVLRLSADGLSSVRPTGFIFHMSRCGSTLVSRLLATLAQNLVISEASPLDWMIRANVRRPHITDEEHIAWIRWMVGALAQQRVPEATHLFVKFDSWHTLYFDLIERAFPDVPWIFLYRDPAEVLVSHLRQRGSGTIPGVVEHLIEGLSLEEAVRFPSDEYPAFVLAEICRAALKQRDNPRARFVNYTRLPDLIYNDLLRHFNVGYSNADIAEMKQAAGYNAKSPGVKFMPDTAEKRREARGAIGIVAQHYFGTIYDELEAVANR